MDAVEVARILESRNLIAMIVVAMIAGVPVVKGIFAVLVGRHQRRKEFLEFWRDAELRQNDLWLEEIVQHRYGTALPARLIRHVESLENPSRKLRKVAMAAGFFDLDRARQQVVWVRPWRARFGWFLVEIAACGFGYFLLASVGIGLVLLGLKQDIPDSVALVFIGFVLTAFACATFWHLISLTEARSTFALVIGAPRPNALQLIKHCASAALRIGRRARRLRAGCTEPTR
jgi:hypothetical protein